ncbi:GntR family transcriptional regulator [[Clostridium] fimetarium]|uniref:DNA-binding transcriptional regulator, GntR family n=1 Tax=[Clostridium] fimetarium TaxID=99656 RepID=A0A1I0PU87_9FIRM|nr:GntR family transcriptional regulator [[Clostridium] fimetarium]SEW18020.1 DNA-binding transcriptional regulator, GntR family [[Clostridium] fimetarium]
MELKVIDKRVTLSDQAYYIIKDAIISSVLKPGEVLITEKLGEKLNISRTPIKAALTRLQYEKILFLNASNNFVVVDITQLDIEEITQVREKVEVLAVELLENKITENQIQILKDIIEKYNIAIENTSFCEMLECEYEFHNTLAEFSENKFLIDTIRTANNIVKIYLMLSGTYEKYCDNANLEHQEIVDFIINKNFGKAKEAMARHIGNLKNRMLNQ